MKRKPIKNITLIILAIAFLPCLASAQGISEKLDELEKEFTQFNYEQVLQKGEFLMGDAFAGKQDSLTILTYMLNSAYALNDTSRAKDIIITILQTDAQYRLDPAENSPKIIDFYNFVRSNSNLYPPAQTTEYKPADPVKTIPGWYYTANVLFPGSGFWLDNDKDKGLTYAAISAVLGGSAIYLTLLTNDRKDTYMNARTGANFNSLYDSYNEAYKWRNILITTYIAYSLYSLYDLHESRHEGPSLALKIRRDCVFAGISMRW